MKNRCVLVVLASSSLLALACEAPPRSEERVGAATLTKAAKPNPTPEPATRRRRARRTLAPSTRWRASPAIRRPRRGRCAPTRGWPWSTSRPAPSAPRAWATWRWSAARRIQRPLRRSPRPNARRSAPEPAPTTIRCGRRSRPPAPIAGSRSSSIQFVPGCARGGVSADFVCCPPPPPPPARDLHEGGRGLPRTLRDRGRAPQRGGGPLPGRRPGPGGRDSSRATRAAKAASNRQAPNAACPRPRR